MATCLIGLGANLGDRAHTLDEAVERLAALPQVSVTARSTWHETSAAGGPPDQPPYLNGALLLQTALDPAALLTCLQTVETQLGRQRAVRWGARLVDLDLLLYDQVVLDTPDLQVPHPRMVVRRFVLDPAVEIAADMLHPTSGWTLAQLAKHLHSAPKYLAIAGPPGVGKSRLARQVARALDAALIDDVPLVLPGGSPSPVFERSLELTDRRVRLVEARLSEAPHRWLVSDFWIPQALAYAEVLLSPAQRQAFGDCWQVLAEQITPPRFTVALHAPVEQLWRSLQATNVTLDQLDEARFGQVARAISALSRQTGVGPVLHFAGDGGENDDDIVAQIVGSAQASQ